VRLRYIGQGRAESKAERIRDASGGRVRACEDLRLESRATGVRDRRVSAHGCTPHILYAAEHSPFTSIERKFIYLQSQDLMDESSVCSSWRVSMFFDLIESKGVI
jgi:hypothetical protein